jgi:hypothetical protein
MNPLARVLAALLVLVMLDAVFEFKVYRSAVRAVASGFCSLTNKSAADRDECTDSIFRSRLLWLLNAIIMGLAAGYVTLQALTSSA